MKQNRTEIAAICLTVGFLALTVFASVRAKPAAPVEITVMTSAAPEAVLAGNDGVSAQTDLPAATAAQQVDLNTADAQQLQTLPGIGPVLAERIVAYRTEHGPFARPEQLCNVRGIGEKTYARLAEYITVS